LLYSAAVNARPPPGVLTFGERFDFGIALRARGDTTAGDESPATFVGLASRAFVKIDGPCLILTFMLRVPFLFSVGKRRPAGREKKRPTDQAFARRRSALATTLSRGGTSTNAAAASARRVAGVVARCETTRSP
jgi:hypothetical protein